MKKKWEIEFKLKDLELKLDNLKWSVENNCGHQQRQIDGILNNTPKVVKLRKELQEVKQKERELERDLMKRGDDV